MHLYANSEEDKKDLYQEIVLQAWKTYSAFRGNAKFSTWLYQLCLNTIFTIQRKINWIEYTDTTKFEETHTTMSGNDEVDRLYKAIRKLTETERAIVSLHLDGYDNKEVGELIGINRKSCRGKISQDKTTISNTIKKYIMDIENIWKQTSGSDEALNTLLQQNDFSNLHSKLPLKKLKKNLLIGIMWALLITAGYITLCFFIHFWQVYFSLGVLIIFNTWIMLESWGLYKQTPSSITPSNSLKDEITSNYNSFQKWLSLQLKVSLIVYPIATAGGFIIVGVLGSGKSVEDFLYNPRMLVILGITVLVFIPLSYYAAKWMFNHAYGKHLKRLKATIDTLS